MNTFSMYLQKRLVEDNLHNEGRFSDFMNTITGGLYSGLGGVASDVWKDAGLVRQQAGVSRTGGAAAQQLTQAQNNVKKAATDAVTNIENAYKQLSAVQQKVINDLTNMKNPAGQPVLAPDQLQFINQIMQQTDSAGKQANNKVRLLARDMGETEKIVAYGTENLQKLVQNAASKIGAQRKFGTGVETEYEAPDVAGFQSKLDLERQKAAAAARKKNLAPPFNAGPPRPKPTNNNNAPTA
jgi:hypothetical protein